MYPWRKPFIFLSLYLSGSHIPRRLRSISTAMNQPRQKILHNQRLSLQRLLSYAARHVPYYSEVLPKSGVIDASGEIHLEHFSNIPVLTKDILRSRYDDLQSDEIQTMKTYENHSGGSTGAPTTFIQTKEYSDWNIANKMYYTGATGKSIGEREMKMWGSDRDFKTNAVAFSGRAQNWLYNRVFVNAFLLSKEKKEEIVQLLQRKHPVLVWGYVDRLYEFSLHLLENDIDIPSPSAVLSGAGTLHPHMKDAISKAFKAPVVNTYGGREVGDMACECLKTKGMHVFHHTHVVETINDKEQPIHDSEGEIIVTPLHNYAMPLIRYAIGDRGVLSEKFCGCGQETDVLQSVSGRVVEMIYAPSGDAVSPLFFVHLVGVVHNDGSIRTFQVRQTALDVLEISMVLPKKIDRVARDDLESRIKKDIQHVMSTDMNVRFAYVEDILPTPSGKFQFVVGQKKEELFDLR